MGFFRHSEQVRTAQSALDTQQAQARRDGNHEETDEYLRLNDAVSQAHRNEKKNKKRS
jgi:hypothetical protein